MGWIFIFFFISGFCSILYEVIWLRLCMAQFGVTSAMVSIVLSIFMAGLGLGSWGSGYAIRKYGERISISALRLYALAELMIGLSAIVVPHELLWGRSLLGRSAVSSSPAYYLISGAWVALTLIPWCACMGATIPIGMWAIRKSFTQGTQRSFSFLYLANVLGAVAGAVLPPLLVEIYGFRGTLKVGAILNGLLFVAAVVLSSRLLSIEGSSGVASSSRPSAEGTTQSSQDSKRILLLLFTTGLTSMGAEVVWIRLFTPYLGTVVYAFATILGVYLASTFLGSRIYRKWSRTGTKEGTLVWGALGLATLLPLVSASPQFDLPGYQVLELLRLVLGIALFSGLLGFVTPMLVDRWSGGDPDRAGRAYAVNVVGCILGPIVAGFLLLPVMSERWVLLVFAAPWLLIGVNPRWSVGSREQELRAWPRYLGYGLTATALVVAFTVKGYYEDAFAGHQVLRDNTATVFASGEGMTKRLVVNGVGITYLTPITKLMAHLPLTFLDHAPSRTLVVCFGMGTTYRSLMSWNIPTTAVELVPSVPRLFWYFHADAPELLRSPLSHVVVDDGRRYLERTDEQFDVITLDPPPPVQAAGTSLLYSKEFYSAVRRRLAPGGILQQWLPTGDAVIQASVARALKESFPYVRVFHSLDNRGFHFLASEHPIVQRSAQQLADRMPEGAVQDLLEWGPSSSAAQQFSIILGRELSLDQLIAGAPYAPALQDDHPENEYYFLRQYLHLQL